MGKLSNVGFYLLDSSDEEEFQRSVIGRFYYSCFNLSKEYFEDKYYMIGHNNVHKTLINVLKRQNNKKEIELGENLDNLRICRINADYHNNFNQINLKKSINILEDILRILKDLK